MAPPAESRRICVQGLLLWWLPLACLQLAMPAQGERTAQGGLQETTHWSFARPERAAVPSVQQAEWPRNAIDHFILDRLEREGLPPSPAADRTTLIRRLCLDLTGLPPGLDEVEAFVADAAPDAYDRLVDRLLTSPHFGERMAVTWLDLARYADTNGYLVDAPRQMWKWRDWVIEAFNRNLPFDRFTTDQLAGDLLPEASIAQRIATGFHRNHPMSGEDSGQPGEYAHRYIADRVATTGAVWLGLTLGCAECHDHKYDPISQRDYYRFYAFFDGVAETGLVSGGNAPPVLRLPSEASGAKLVELDGRIERLRAQQQRLAAADALARDRWLAELRREPPPAATSVGLKLLVPLEESVAAAQLRGIGDADWIAGVRGRALELFGKDSFVDCGSAAAFGAADAFSLSVWVRQEGKAGADEGTIIAKVDESRQGRGYALGLDGGVVYFDLVSTFSPRDRIGIAARDALAPHRWHHLAVSYDGSRTVAGLRLYVDGEVVPLAEPGAEEKQQLEGDIDHGDSLRIGCIDGDPFAGVIDEARIYDRSLSADEVRGIVMADLAALAASTEPLTPEQAFLLGDYHQSRVSPELRPVLAEWRELAAQRRAVLDDVPVVSVLAEPGQRSPTRVLLRGDYSQPGEIVTAGVPDWLPALPAETNTDRLALARWLVHPDHPLVGRVAVNRLWAQLFGTGLVATLDDFGTQGERPSHPRLLDWLAREFVDGGWDTKAMVRLMVTSAAYRQQSRVTPELSRRDPLDRLHARAPRLPLPAELVRDNALAIAGLLDRRLLGPSIRPWQPDGLWLAAAAFEGQRYTPSPVADRYRRGLYVSWKRGVLYASFSVFDAPSREVCTVSRTRTNTPLQALVLLNDRVYVEAARALAARLLSGDGSDDERLVRGFRLCVARAPNAAELEVLRRQLARHRAHFGADSGAAAAFVAFGDPPQEKHGDEREAAATPMARPASAGTEHGAPAAASTTAAELAAWTGVGTLLLNLDETITRG